MSHTKSRSAVAVLMAIMTLSAAPVAAQVELRPVGPASVSLRPGASPLEVELEGVDPMSVQAAAVYRDGQPVRGVRAAITGRTGGRLAVRLTADGGAPVGDDYTLMLRVGNEWLPAPVGIQVTPGGDPPRPPRVPGLGAGRSPDLIIPDARVVVRGGGRDFAPLQGVANTRQALGLEITGRNIGQAPAVFERPDLHWRLVDGPGGVVAQGKYRCGDRIDPGQSCDGAAPLAEPGQIPPGDYRLVLAIDPDDRVRESVETNNTREIRLRVAERGSARVFDPRPNVPGPIVQGDLGGAPAPAVADWSPKEKAYPGQTLTIDGQGFDPEAITVETVKGNRVVRLPTVSATASRVVARFNSNHSTGFREGDGASLQVVNRPPGANPSRARVLDPDYRVINREARFSGKSLWHETESQASNVFTQGDVTLRLDGLDFGDSGSGSYHENVRLVLAVDQTEDTQELACVVPGDTRWVTRWDWSPQTVQRSVQWSRLPDGRISVSPVGPFWERTALGTVEEDLLRAEHQSQLLYFRPRTVTGPCGCEPEAPLAPFPIIVCRVNELDPLIPVLVEWVLGRTQ